jgi:hypothetical protein
MTDFKSSVPLKPAPSRRKYVRAIILAVCATLALTVFVFCFAVTVMMAAAINGFGGLFQGIGEAVAFTFSTAIILSVLVIFPWLMELASLLSTGQLIPFFMRLIHLLVN